MPCPHGRRRAQCKECGGSGICEHGRRRRECKECGGSAICEHGRIRTRCKECGGDSSGHHGLQHINCEAHPVHKPAQQIAASAALQPPIMASTIEEGDVLEAQPVVGVSVELDDANESLMAAQKRPLQCSRLERFTKKLKQFQDSQAEVTYHDVD